MIEKLNEQQKIELNTLLKSLQWSWVQQYLAGLRENYVKKLVNGSFNDNENDDTVRGGIRAYDHILGLQGRLETNIRKTLDSK